MSERNRVGRPFKFPNPEKRSKADPSIIVNSNQVLGLYNRATGENAKYVTEKVQAWFKAEALAKGWNKAEFAGGQCILSMDF